MCAFHAVDLIVTVFFMKLKKKSQGSVQQFPVQCNHRWNKVALCDKVPGDDVDVAEFEAGALLLHPANECKVGGHHQVLQGLCRVCADVLQVHCEIHSRHKEPLCQEHKQKMKVAISNFLNRCIFISGLY